MKDYCFELESDNEDLSLSMSIPKQNPVSQLKASKGVAATQPQGFGAVRDSGSRPAGKAVKIPQLADYL